MRAFVLTLLVFLCSCGKPVEQFAGIAMTVPYRILIGEKISSKQKKQIDTLITKVFEKTHATFNNWNPHSEISKLNQLGAGEKVVISKELKDLLLLSKEIYEKSGKRFDPTVGKVAKVWKEALCSCEIPRVIDIQSLGMNHITIEGDYFWKDDSNVTLDLCGIAKGHTVDLLTEELLRAGFSNFYVEWGGEICTRGKHPDNRPWSIGIKGVTTVAMSEGALATSGNYEQFWQVGEKVYTHIIDPRSGEALQVTPTSIASATVMAPSCAIADAIATALMLFESPESAIAWAESFPHVKCWVAKKIN